MYCNYIQAQPHCGRIISPQNMDYAPKPQFFPFPVYNHFQSYPFINANIQNSSPMEGFLQNSDLPAGAELQLRHQLVAMVSSGCIVRGYIPYQQPMFRPLPNPFMQNYHPHFGILANQMGASLVIPSRNLFLKNNSLNGTDIYNQPNYHFLITPTPPFDHFTHFSLLGFSQQNMNIYNRFRFSPYVCPAYRM